MKLLQLLLIATLASISSSALPTTWGVSDVVTVGSVPTGEVNNARLNLDLGGSEIQGYADGTGNTVFYVTGTNVNFSGGATISAVSPPQTQGGYFTYGYLTNVQLTVAGQGVGTYSNPGPERPTGKTWLIRFASTHFPDNTDLTVTVTASGKIVREPEEQSWFKISGLTR